MTFSSEEILEEFAEASHKNLHPWWSAPTPESPQELQVGHFSGQPQDVGTRFIEGDEKTREEMRTRPPRMPWDTFVDCPKRRWGTITYADAQTIRSLVPRHMSGREAARQYGVSHITIQRIIAGKTYRADRTRLGPAEIRLLRAGKDK